MFNIKGNFKQAHDELTKNDNNAVAHVYDEINNNDSFVVTLKDLFATVDAPTQASSRILKDFKPGYDATVVKKLKEANASIVGKTHMDELALGGTGLYSAFGKIVNPIDPLRLIGGSSSGAAATMTKNVSLALGSDTGDSVRLPASYVGVVGFKPSYGAISRYGMFPFASSLDTVSFFTHNVEDAIVASNILFGRDDLDMVTKDVVKPIKEMIKPKTVSVLDVDKFISPQVKKQLEALIKLLEDDGTVVKRIKIEEKLLEQIGTVYNIISFSEVSTNNANLTGISFGNRVEGEDWEKTMINSRSTNLGYMVQRRMILGSAYLKEQNQFEVFQKAQRVRRLLTDEIKKAYSETDVLIFPSTTIAPLISEGKANNLYSNILGLANLSGCPSISIPFGKEDNMPFGLTVEANLYDDSKLLSHTLYIEELIGGMNE